MTKDEALRTALKNLLVATKHLDVCPGTVEAAEAALAQPEQQEPLTEWLVCPKCKYKSPYTPIKAATLAEDAERITKQTRAALAQPKREWVGLTDEEYEWCGDENFPMIRVAEMLKEKNHG
jgi:hypothetical protein